MFENKFNSKKVDPLVEAVKAAQADGDMRRAAIAQVNEAFGVYSRNAVVRENLASYDAAIEEAYNSIKEGEKWEGSKEDKDEDKKLAKKHGMSMKQWEKSDADKKHDKKEKEDDKDDSDDKCKCDEELKGDQPSIDANKDKKISGADFKILRARKKIHEKKMWQEGVKGNVEIDYSAPDRAAVTSGGKPATPAQTTSAPQDAPTPPKRPANLQELKKPTPKTAMNAYYRAYDSDVQSGGEGKRTARLGRWKEKHLPGKSARNQKDTGKAELDDYDRKTVKKSGVLTKKSQTDTSSAIKSRLGKHTAPHLPEEAQIDEVSKRTAISAYREKMAQDRDTKKLGDLIQNKWGRETAKHAYRAGAQDTVGLVRRGESHGVDRLASAKSSSEMRKTKDKKIHGQDIASKKSEIKFRRKMSKFDKKGHLPEEALDEATKKHFIAHAADIAKISDQKERNAAATAAADTYARLNKRFDHAKFHKAAGSTAHETQTVKESVLEAVRAKYMREMVVQKSQMRPGETLGQTMNRLQGKTAIKGGANDPSSPSFKGPKPAATASSSSGGDTGYKSDGGRTVSLKPTADSGTAQAAEPAKAAPTPAAQPKGWSAPKDVDQSKTVAASGGAAPADKPDTRTPQQRWDDSRSATNTPAPGVASRTSSAEVASGATAAKQSSDSVAKLMKMNESVQVGANKYRIV